jgi:hypothetical protein
MAPAAQLRKQNVANIAGRILITLRSRPYDQELAELRRMIPDIRPIDSLETERLEVLEGAVEWLDSPMPERVQAATVLLEHLAKA